MADRAYNAKIKAKGKTGAATYSYISTDKSGCWKNYTSFQAGACMDLMLNGNDLMAIKTKMWL